MHNVTENNINLLIEKLALEDSETALQSLYELYFEKLARLAYQYIQSYSTIEEIISDVFLSIWFNRKELINIQNFNAYILTITRNKTISHFRKEEKFNFAPEEYLIDSLFNTETTPEDDYISQELMTELDKAVESLPTQCRAAFKLVREEKMKYKDAAQALNISVKTLEAHITKATKILRRIAEGNS